MGDFLPASFFKYIITAAQNLPILRPALALQKKKKKNETRGARDVFRSKNRGAS